MDKEQWRSGLPIDAPCAITINAGANDAVTLRGLDIDGLGTGANGIVFNTGGSLTVVTASRGILPITAI